MTEYYVEVSVPDGPGRARWVLVGNGTGDQDKAEAVYEHLVSTGARVRIVVWEPRILRHSENEVVTPHHEPFFRQLVHERLTNRRNKVADKNQEPASDDEDFFPSHKEYQEALKANSQSVAAALGTHLKTEPPLEPLPTTLVYPEVIGHDSNGSPIYKIPQGTVNPGDTVKFEATSLLPGDPGYFEAMRDRVLNLRPKVNATRSAQVNS